MRSPFAFPSATVIIGAREERTTPPLEWGIAGARWKSRGRNGVDTNDEKGVSACLLMLAEDVGKAQQTC